MTAKEWLSQYKDIDDEIDSMIATRDRLHMVAMQTTAGAGDGQPKSATRSNSARFTSMIEKVVDIDARIDAAVDRLCDLRTEIERVISQVNDPKLRTILRYKYIAGYTWEKISQVTHRELRWVYRLHGRALQNVNEILTMVDHDTSVI